jgi:hypothetical protein
VIVLILAGGAFFALTHDWSHVVTAEEIAAKNANLVDSVISAVKRNLDDPDSFRLVASSVKPVPGSGSEVYIQFQGRDSHSDYVFNTKYFYFDTSGKYIGESDTERSDWGSMEEQTRAAEKVIEDDKAKAEASRHASSN